MSDKQRRQPIHVWLPKVVLTFLVLLVLSFVVYQTIVGMEGRDLGQRSMWALIVAMVLLVLLPVVERIQEISISPSGFKATLSEAKARALEEVNALEDPEVAVVARRQILEAESPDQIEAAKAMAIDLNVERILMQIKTAIRERRKCYVRYKPDPEAAMKTYHVAPLDVKAGATEATKARDYLWAHSYEHESTVSLRLDRVHGFEMSKETFDPQEIMANWDDQEQAWNVYREW